MQRVFLWVTRRAWPWSDAVDFPHRVRPAVDARVVLRPAPIQHGISQTPIGHCRRSHRRHVPAGVVALGACRPCPCRRRHTLRLRPSALGNRRARRPVPRRAQIALSRLPLALQFSVHVSDACTQQAKAGKSAGWRRTGSRPPGATSGAVAPPGRAELGRTRGDGPTAPALPTRRLPLTSADCGRTRRLDLGGAAERPCAPMAFSTAPMGCGCRPCLQHATPHRSAGAPFCRNRRDLSSYRWTSQVWISRGPQREPLPLTGARASCRPEAMPSAPTAAVDPRPQPAARRRTAPA